MRFLLFLLLGFTSIQCGMQEKETTVLSPDGNLRVRVFLTDSLQLAYTASYKDSRFVDTSLLGYRFKNLPDLKGNLSIIGVQRDSKDEYWQTVWGTHDSLRNNFREMKLLMRENFDPGRLFNITFRVFDDGLGFRYSFPEQEGLTGEIVIMEELTEFMLAEDLTAWWIPADYDSYEYNYTRSRVSEIDASRYNINNERPDRMCANMRAANTPITFVKDDGLYLSIHEAELVDHPEMTLALHGTHGLKAELVPWANGDRVRAKTPFNSPWRTIQVAETVDALIHSPLILNLNPPGKIENTAWIEPMVYTGIWWEMHIGKSSWGQQVEEGSWSGANIKYHGANTENIKKYIDFNAANGIRGLLFEGWNTGWEYWGLDTLGFFDFLTSYDDLNYDEVVEYAIDKGVSIIGHHETSGDAENYERRLEDAYRFYQSKGVHAVKTGYAGGIVPRGEYHHGQWMVRHYRKVIETAARFQIAINAHEPIKDTGERRTWPNMLTREGVKGTEYEAWSEGNPPDHTTILPFTRMLAGPLDYTAGIFDVFYNEYKPDNRVHTTLAKQLALMVILYSPNQMAADLPENYEGHPAFQFIRDLVADWSDSKVIDGAIGEHITIARRERNGAVWFLGSITNESPRTMAIPLDFLDESREYQAVIYGDAEDADWESNPMAYKITNEKLMSKDTLRLTLAAGGGAAVRISPITN